MRPDRCSTPARRLQQCMAAKISNGLGETETLWRGIGIAYRLSPCYTVAPLSDIHGTANEGCAI